MKSLLNRLGNRQRRQRGVGSNVDKSRRMQLKLVGIIIGVAILIAIMISQIVWVSKGKVQGTYIAVEDVRILAKALDPNFEASALNVEWKSLDNRTDYLNYQQLGQLLDYFEGESEQYTDRVSLSKTVVLPDYGNTYKKKDKVTAKDWYQLFELLKTYYDTTGSIIEDDIVVLGSGNHVIRNTGEEIAENEILSVAGYLYIYENSVFKTCDYKTLHVIRKGSELLTVLTEKAEDITFKNTWVKDAAEESIRIFVKEYDVLLDKDKDVAIEREQVADLVIKDGVVQSVNSKKEKYSGKLIQVADGVFEIEGHGKVAAADEIKVYKLFGTLEQRKIEDLIIGYDFTDFVIEDGKICAALITRDGAMENIRVLLRNSGFAGTYHEGVSLSVDTEYDVICGEETVTHAAGEVFTVSQADVQYDDKRIYIKPKALTGQISVSSIERATGVPSYRGTLEIERTGEGYVLINEVLLEEYLYAVVPSEMPASYPAEALKAQATCARTYAYKYMLKAGIGQFGAHVDDSTSYQVYNNIEESMESTAAVKDTKGQVMKHEGELAGAYYYSTSCGYGTNACVWSGNNAESFPYLQAKQIAVENVNTVAPDKISEEEMFAAYIQTVNEYDYEKTEGWYRWRYVLGQMDKDVLLGRIKERYATNPNYILTKTNDSYEAKELGEIGTIQNIYVAKRLDGGVIDELVIVGSKAEIKVISEYNVRYILSDGNTKVVRQDGSEVGPSALLPSAFLIITPTLDKNEVVGYSIVGGGYGHGVGMSQNGAKNMSVAGVPYEQILTFFYNGIQLETVY